MNNPKQVVFKLDGKKSVKGLFTQRPGELPTLLLKAYIAESDDRVAVGPPSIPSEAERRQHFSIEDARENYLRTLAAEYHKRCDAFDALVSPKGEPRNGQERWAINVHAAGVKADLYGRILVTERTSLRYYIAEGGRVNAR